MVLIDNIDFKMYVFIVDNIWIYFYFINLNSNVDEVVFLLNIKRRLLLYVILWRYLK